LDTLLKGVFPSEQFCLYGSRDSFIPYYSGKFETVELPEHGDYNATEIREQYADKVFASNDFRAGILYAYYNQYTKVYPTVDIAVFRNNKTEILLGKKANNSKWRLVGGFADPEDESFEAAAKRELTEECGELETTAMTYETSRKINDWRYRNEADKIITSLFSCDYINGNPVAQDDIVDLAWFKLGDLPQMMADDLLNNEHIALLNFMITKYK
jgi:bifunctional NMN adenylyltransferase/nudix hydrolase